MTTQGPRFVTPDSAAVIATAVIDAMRAELPTWLISDADPGVYWADAVAEAIEAFSAAINDGLAEAFPPTAGSEALDLFLASVGLEPKPGETVQDKRRRYRRRWLSLRPDTPEYYVELAHVWDEEEGHDPPRVVEAAAEWQPSSGTVNVYVYDGERAPLTDVEYESLERWLNATRLRPIYIYYRALAPRTATYSLYIGVHFGESVLNRAAALEQIGVVANAWLDRNRHLNVGVAISAVEALIQEVEGVVAVRVVISGAESQSYLPPRPGILHDGRIGRLVDLTS